MILEKYIKTMIAYWLKDMVAYYKNAARRGQSRIVAFMCCVFSVIYSPNLSVEVLLNLVLETVKIGVDVMALLDKVNTEAYGNPEMTKVNIGVKPNPCF